MTHNALPSFPSPTPTSLRSPGHPHRPISQSWHVENCLGLPFSSRSKSIRARPRKTVKCPEGTGHAEGLWGTGVEVTAQAEIRQGQGHWGPRDSP